MSSQSELDRRDFFRRAGGALGLGAALGLGLDVRPVQAATTRLKIVGAREVPSVCPYCAVGCGQFVSVRSGQIVNIEGNPDSPINRGTLCPKGAASFQLAVNPHRLTSVLYRAPRGSAWQVKPLDWAMDRIAQRVQETRDATFQEFWETTTADGGTLQKRVNHTLAIASLGGATMDNEWNYVQAKLLRSLGVVAIENQART